MKKSTLLSLIFSSMLSSFSFSQDLIIENLERFESNTKKVLRFKTPTLKVKKIEFFNENSKVISRINYDTISGKLIGDFFDPYNKGFYEKGKLNCEKCEFSFDDEEWYEMNISEGKIEGIVTKKNIKVNSYRGNVLVNKNSYSEVPDYILSNIERYFINIDEKEKITNTKIDELFFTEGLLNGVQKINYNFNNNTSRYLQFPITKSELFFNNGILKGYKTIDSNNDAIDSIYNDNKIWKYEKELIKNKGELFYPFQVNNKFEFEFWNTSLGEQLVESKMVSVYSTEGFDGKYDLPIYFFPSNLNSYDEGILKIEIGEKHLLTNTLFIDKLTEIIFKPDNIFNDDFSYFDISEYNDRYGKVWGKFKIGISYFEEVSDLYKLNEVDGPLDFFNLIKELVVDNKIYINKLYLNPKVKNNKLSEEFIEILFSNEDLESNNRFFLYSINELEPYFKFFDERYSSYKKNIVERTPIIRKTLEDLITINLKLDDLYYPDMYLRDIDIFKSIKRSKENFIKNHIENDSLLNNQNEIYRRNTLSKNVEDSFKKLYFLKDEEFSDWIKVKLNIISITDDWISDIKKWDKINISLKELFYTLFTKYPITNNSRNDIVNKIVTQSQFNIPKNSFILNYLPYSGLLERYQYQHNVLDMMFLMEKISESTFKIKSLKVGGSPLKSKNKRLSNNSFKTFFEFSNYKENYVKNKQYFNENLPNYGYPFDNLFKEIKSKYKEKFISEIINSSRIPKNQKVITTLGFKCDNKTFDQPDNPNLIMDELKNIYNNLGLNSDRMVIYESTNSDLGIKLNSPFGYFPHTFYNKEKDFLKDINMLNENRIKYLVPKSNYFNILGGCEKKEKYFNYSIVIIGNLKI